MNIEAFMSKLKELKLQMAKLENLESKMPEGEEAELSEGEGVQKIEQEMGSENHEAPKESGEELADDDLMEMFGKKKKVAPKAGMKIAVAISKPKAKAAMGKFK